MEKQKSGMDIDLGNRCSRNAYNWSKATFKNRDGKPGMPAEGLEGGFSNLLLFGSSRIGIASDGIGTKIELAERTGIYDTLGFDLMAMVVDDLATAGFEPSNISNIIDVNRLDYDVIDRLMKGLHDAANFCGVAISGGEIAELGDRIGGYGEGMNFNWCSTAIGNLHKSLEQPISGLEIREGDQVISVRSQGFRSNGFSLIRRSMQSCLGDKWHEETFQDGRSWGEVLLTPSLIYSPLIVALLDAGLIPSGIVHITGGGIADNFARVLRKTGLGASLDSLQEPLPVMKALQELAGISDEQAYLYWNMGNGMLIVQSPDRAEQCLRLCKEAKYEAQVCGVIDGSGMVSLEAGGKKIENVLS